MGNESTVQRAGSKHHSRGSEQRDESEERLSIAPEELPAEFGSISTLLLAVWKLFNRSSVSSYYVPSMIFLELGHSFNQWTFTVNAEKVVCSLFLTCFSYKFQILCRFFVCFHLFLLLNFLKILANIWHNIFSVKRGEQENILLIESKLDQCFF